MNGKACRSGMLLNVALLWISLALPGQSFGWDAGHWAEILPDEPYKAQRAISVPPAPLPVVEMPAKGNGCDTLTIFYSGDGGWRDLDKVVAEEMAKEGYPVVGVDCLRGFWTRKLPEQASDDLARVMNYYRHHWGAKRFVLAGYSFGADILPPIYNRLSPHDRDSIPLLVLLGLSKDADFEIRIAGYFGEKTKGMPLSPELSRLPAAKLFCVYGLEEKLVSGCMNLTGTGAEILELPGGHHFDEDYQKLTRLILEKYRKTGLAKEP